MRVRTPVQNEISVWNRLLIDKCDRALRWLDVLDRYVVQQTLDIFNGRATAVDCHTHRDIVTCAFARAHGRRCDTTRVRDTRGVIRETRPYIFGEHGDEESPVDLADSARCEVHAALRASICVICRKSQAFGEGQKLIDRFIFCCAHRNRALKKCRHSRDRNC